MFNYKSFINIYTWNPIGSNHSCTGHIFVKYNDKIGKFNVGVIQTNIIDHFSTIVSISVKETLNTSKINDFYLIHLIEVESNLKTEKWIDVYSSQYGNVGYEFFIVN